MYNDSMNIGGSCDKRGFTLVEIILVLAVAALIILMVLLTAPAVSRSQRNNATRQNVNRIVAAVDEYKSNNRGRMPWHAPEYATAGNYYDRCFGNITKPPAGANTSHCVLDPYLDLEDGYIYAIKGSFYKDQSPKQLEGDWYNVSAAEIKIYPGLHCAAFTSDGGWTDGSRSMNNRDYVWPNDLHYAVIVHLDGTSGRNQRVYFCVDG